MCRARTRNTTTSQRQERIADHLRLFETTAVYRLPRRYVLASPAAYAAPSSAIACQSTVDTPSYRSVQDQMDRLLPPKTRRVSFSHLHDCMTDEALGANSATTTLPHCSARIVVKRRQTQNSDTIPRSVARLHIAAGVYLLGSLAPCVWEGVTGEFVAIAALRRRATPRRLTGHRHADARTEPGQYMCICMSHAVMCLLCRAHLHWCCWVHRCRLQPRLVAVAPSA